MCMCVCPKVYILEGKGFLREKYYFPLSSCLELYRQSLSLFLFPLPALLFLVILHITYL